MKLVTFGDSWPYGSDLAPGEQPFGNLLAQQLKATQYVNQSIPATSNEHMILQLQQYAHSQADVSGHVALFFITSAARACFIDYNNVPVEVRPDARASKDSLYYYYFKHFHTPGYEKFRHHVTMLALQRMSAELGLQDFYVCGWETPSFDFPGINVEKIYDHGKTHCAHMLKNDSLKNNLDIDQYTDPRSDHPTQLGHQIIANTLYNWIKDKIV